MITNISIDKLHPHPHNPRKQLGDLAELAESIKATGVLQNLTVVQINPGEEDTDYTVIIGHRRLGAARLAGLSQLPCAIAHMDDKTQIATMLLENIQRSDLNPLEQAQGFQLMLDIGDTVGGIAEKTGLSNSTIRRRVKLMELDPDKLAQAVCRNATLEDYEALNKIRDIDRRNQVLEKIGTPDFKWRLSSAIKDEENAEKMAVILEKAKRFALELKNKETHKYQYVKTLVDTDFDPPEDAGEQQYYYVEYQTYVGLYAEKKAVEKLRKTPEELENEEKERQLASLFRQAYEQRLTFAKGFTAKGKIPDIVVEKAIDLLFSREDSPGTDVFRALFGIEKKFRNSWEAEKEGETYEEAIARLTDGSDAKNRGTMLFKGVYCEMESESYSCVDYRRRYRRDTYLEELYEFLIRLGYAMSAEEEMLLTGTHELYESAEEVE